MSTATTSPHVTRADDGVAWITGTKVKVVEIVADRLAHGSSPEELHFQYPHLSLAQIHSALAYYYDHQTELEADIARRLEQVEALRAKAAGQPVRKELLARRRR